MAGGFRDGLFTALCDFGEGSVQKILYTVCCPSCAMASVIGDLPPSSRVPCAGSCCGACSLLLIPTVGQRMFTYARCSARCWLRQKSGGPPAALEDCLSLVFCWPCATVQELIQIDALRERGKIGAPPASLHAMHPPKSVIIMR